MVVARSRSSSRHGRHPYRHIVPQHSTYVLIAASPSPSPSRHRHRDIAIAIRHRRHRRHQRRNRAALPSTLYAYAYAICAADQPSPTARSLLRPWSFYVHSVHFVSTARSLMCRWREAAAGGTKPKRETQAQNLTTAASSPAARPQRHEPQRQGLPRLHCTGKRVRSYSHEGANSHEGTSRRASELLEPEHKHDQHQKQGVNF